MLPVEEIDNIIKSHPNPGWASVYQFKQEDALSIKEAYSSKDLDRYSVASNELIIDFDGGMNIGSLRYSLVSKNVGFKIYESGGKGVHLHIATLPIEGIGVPYSQKKFVQGLFKEADLSIYGHGKLIALPGRIHPKTGNKKRLFEIYNGEGTLNIPLLSPPPEKIRLDPIEASYEWAFYRMGLLLENPPAPGERHNRFWGVSKSLMEAGVDPDLVFDLLWPLYHRLGKDEQDLQRAIKDAQRDL